MIQFRHFSGGVYKFENSAKSHELQTRSKSLQNRLTLFHALATVMTLIQRRVLTGIELTSFMDETLRWGKTLGELPPNGYSDRDTAG
jgi:hypothetical protein